MGLASRDQGAGDGSSLLCVLLTSPGRGHPCSAGERQPPFQMADLPSLRMNWGGRRIGCLPSFLVLSGPQTTASLGHPRPFLRPARWQKPRAWQRRLGAGTGPAAPFPGSQRPGEARPGPAEGGAGQLADGMGSSRSVVEPWVQWASITHCKARQLPRQLLPLCRPSAWIKPASLRGSGTQEDGWPRSVPDGPTFEMLHLGQLLFAGEGALESHLQSREVGHVGQLFHSLAVAQRGWATLPIVPSH